MGSNQRHFLPAFAELVDRLTVDQIKEVLLPDTKAAMADEMDKICHDIDLIISERQLDLNARMIRILIALSQINMHIWHLKDRMQQYPEHYADDLKLAHQLNGIRNQLKNKLLEESADKERSAQRTNFNTDGLQGWEISID